jgi:hypothetical protein
LYILQPRGWMRVSQRQCCSQILHACIAPWLDSHLMAHSIIGHGTLLGMLNSLSLSLSLMSLFIVSCLSFHPESMTHVHSRSYCLVFLFPMLRLFSRIC